MSDIATRLTTVKADADGPETVLPQVFAPHPSSADAIGPGVSGPSLLAAAKVEIFGDTKGGEMTTPAGGRDLFGDGGEAGRLMRQIDWARAPLGPASGWPAALRTAVRIMLGSRSPAFVWWGGDFITLYNDAFAADLGPRHPHALGSPAATAWADVWETVGPHARAALDGPEAPDIDLPLLPARRRISFTVLIDDSGQRGLLGTVAAESEERSRLVVESADLGTWDHDPLTGALVWSDRQKAMFGLSPSAAVSMDVFTERLHPDDRARVADAIGEALRGGGTGRLDVECRAMWPDGKLRWVMLRGRAERVGEGPGGRAVRLLGTAQDVTDRKRTEEELREARGRLQDALDAGAIVTWSWDVPADPDLSGPAGGLRGVHPDDRERVSAALRAAVESGQPCEIDYRVVQPDQSVRWMAARGRVDHDEAGRPERLRGVLVDVTERKRLEDEVRLRADQLAENDRRKDEFLAMLAHELRNPLAPIRNSLHILRQAAAPAAAVTQAREIAARQVQHLSRLLDDLLDVSRLSRGKIQLRQEPVDLAPLLNRTVEAARPLAEQRGHQLTVTLGPDQLRVQGDPTRLEQIVMNLLNNACKYTDPGGDIRLSAGREGNEVVVRVKDNGVGIPADMLPKVFDLFVQAERRLDRSQGGIGIGLTLVKQLVDLHGGSVRAFSDGPGQGSEFVIRLPALALADDDPDDEGPAALAAVPVRRVLVVDDSPDAADSLAVLLQTAGQTVRTAYDGPSALRVATEFRPALVVLDIGMPGMDGYEVARRLRLVSGLEDVRLVALTGWGLESDRQRSREAGFDAHLVKPVDPALLADLLTDVGRS